MLGPQKGPSSLSKIIAEQKAISKELEDIKKEIEALKIELYEKYLRR